MIKKKIFNLFTLGLLILPFATPSLIANAEDKQEEKAKDILSRINQKNNLFNADFPSASRDSILGNSIQESKEYQLAFTYATLKGKDSYKDAFDGEGKVVEDWNKLNNGVNFGFKIGSKNLIKSVQSTEENKDTSNDATAAQKTESSSPGVSTNSKIQDTLESTIADSPMVSSIAKNIADKTWQGAVGNKNHTAVAADARAFDNSTESINAFNKANRFAGINWGGGWVDDGNNIKTSFYAVQIPAKAKVNANRDKTIISKDNVMSESITSKDPAPDAYYQLIKSAVVKELTTNKKKSDLAKQSSLQKIVDKITFEKLYNNDKTFIDKSGLMGVGESYKSTNHVFKMFGINGSSEQQIVGISIENGAIGKDESQLNSVATDAMSKISPKTIVNSKIGKYDSYFYQYSKRITESSKYKVSNEDAELFKSSVDNYEETKKSQDTATVGNRVLGWTPLYPTVKGKNDGSQKDLEQIKRDEAYNVDGQGYLLDNKKSNSEGKAWLQYDVLDKFSKYLNNDDKYNVGLNIGSSDSHTFSIVGDWYYKLFNDKKGKLTLKNLPDDSSNKSQVYGVDTIGNIINGEQLSVAIPYWMMQGDYFTPTPDTTLNSQLDASKDKLGDVTNSQLGNIIPEKSELFKDAIKIRDAIKKMNSFNSTTNYIGKVNESVGENNDSSNYSDKSASALSALLVASLDSKTSKVHSAVISGATGIKQLYIGDSNTNKNETSAVAKKGSNLFSATDIVQYVGLSFFNGSFQDLRKTTAAAVVNNYNSTIVENKNGSFFSGDQFVGSSLIYSTGLVAFYIIAIIVAAIWLVAAYRFFFRTEKLTEGIRRTMIFSMILLLTGAMPLLQNLFYNYPSKVIAQKPIMQQAIVDQYSRLRQQQSLENVFYSSLFGDKFGGVNKSTDYMLKFYTAETKSGQINKDQLANADINNKDKSKDTTVAINKMFNWKGNGATSPFISLTNKNTQVSMMDLISWSSHMTRQKYSEQAVQGYDPSSQLYEEANGIYEISNQEGKSQDQIDKEKANDPYSDRKIGNKWKPGRQPLFDWLAHNYMPVGSENQGQMVNSNSSTTKVEESKDKSSETKTDKNETLSSHDTAIGWKSEIQKIAKASGQDISEDEVNMLISLINAESGGQESITQGIKDVNSANGTPAQGLLQYVPSTFEKYAVEGHSNIKSGIDQLYALFNNSNWKQDLARTKGAGGWGPTGERITDKAGEVESSTSTKTTSGAEFGKDRNPADTSQKSAYNGGENGLNEINNSALYKDLDGVYEMAVNTKFYASETQKKMGEKDSAGEMLTASDSFLRVWQVIFESGSDGSERGMMNNFISLSNVSNAINGVTGFNKQVNASVTGASGELINGVNTDFTPNLAGKDALIKELSMPNELRTGENGKDNMGYSYAARQMIAKFNLAAPESDYFDLSNNGIYSMYNPYEKDKGQKGRTITQINKKALNDYITNMSTVRSSIKPSDSTDLSKGPITAVDPFTMAESQIMAVNLWFNMNKTFGYKTFATGFEANGFSQDAMNRIVYVPIAEIGKTVNDASQYNDGDINTKSPVRLQDNVSEYFTLRASLWGDIGFMFAQFSESIYSWLVGTAIKWLYIIVLILSIVQFWRIRGKNEGQFKQLMNGTLMFLLVFGTAKFLHNWLLIMMGESMNNGYISNSYYKLPLESHAWAHLLINGIIIFWLIKYYLPNIKQNWSTLGGQATFGETVNRSLNGKSPISPSKSLIAQANQLSRLRGLGNIKRSIAYRSSLIASRVALATGVAGLMGKRLYHSNLLSKLRKNNVKVPSGIYDNEDVQKVKDIIGAKVDGLTPTTSNGMSGSQSFMEANTGEMLIPMSENSSKILGLTRDENGMVRVKSNSVQANSPEGRKELLNDARVKIGKSLSELANSNPPSYSNNGDIPVLRNKDGYRFSVGGSEGVDKEKLDNLLSSLGDTVQVVSTPIKSSDGSYVDGTVDLIPKSNFNPERFQKAVNKSANANSNYLKLDEIGKVDGNDLSRAEKLGIKSTADGSLLIKQGNQEHLEFAKSLMTKRNSSIASQKDELNQTMSVLNDSILNGQKFSEDGGLVTNFRSDNTNSADLAEALTKLNKSPNFSRKSVIAQRDLVNDMIVKSGSPQSFVGDIQSSLISDKSIPSGKAVQASKLIDKFIKNNPEDIDFASQPKGVQNQIIRETQELTSKLDDMKVLNKTQNNLIKHYGMQNAKSVQDINVLRNQVNSSNPKSRVLFQNSSIGNIGRTSSYTSDSSIFHNPKTNVVSINRDKNDKRSKAMNNSLRSFLNN